MTRIIAISLLLLACGCIASRSSVDAVERRAHDHEMRLLRLEQYLWWTGQSPELPGEPCPPVPAQVKEKQFAKGS